MNFPTICASGAGGLYPNELCGLKRLYAFRQASTSTFAWSHRVRLKDDGNVLGEGFDNEDFDSEGT